MEAHEAVIEQWLHVGLFLFHIDTVAQKLWTVAYSYALHILAAHPGHHRHADHPTAHIDVLDTDYDLEDHPFSIHFTSTEHLVPNTHYMTCRTGRPIPTHIATTLPRLYKKFRNLMRLKGILCAILFIKHIQEHHQPNSRLPKEWISSTGLHPCLHHPCLSIYCSPAALATHETKEHHRPTNPCPSRHSFHPPQP